MQPIVALCTLEMKLYNAHTNQRSVKKNEKCTISLSLALCIRAPTHIILALSVSLSLPLSLKHTNTSLFTSLISTTAFRGGSLFYYMATMEREFSVSYLREFFSLKLNLSVRCKTKTKTVVVGFHRFGLFCPITNKCVGI